MIDYIKSILPRIQKYSKKLNDQANFVDIPWSFIDGDGDRVTYLFRPNNELLVTKRGEVATGKWEYITVMQSLLIEYEGKKRMYNQGFLDKAILLLRKDGTEDIFGLANPKKISDLKIDTYLEKKLLPSINTIEKKPSKPKVPQDSKLPRESTKDGAKLFLKLKEYDDRIVIHCKKGSNWNFYRKGNQVFWESSGNQVPTGIYILFDGGKLNVENGQIAQSGTIIAFVIIIIITIIILFIIAITIETAS